MMVIITGDDDPLIDGGLVSLSAASLRYVIKDQTKSDFIHLGHSRLCWMLIVKLMSYVKYSVVVMLTLNGISSSFIKFEISSSYNSSSLFKMTFH